MSKRGANRKPTTLAQLQRKAPIELPVHIPLTTEAHETYEKADQAVTAQHISAKASTFIVEVDGETFSVKVIPSGELEIAAIPENAVRQAPKVKRAGSVLAPMQGLILKLKVQVGDPVEKGDVVAVLEAMKMQNNVLAGDSGIVQEIFVNEGQTVQAKDVLMVMK